MSRINHIRRKIYSTHHSSPTCLVCLAIWIFVYPLFLATAQGSTHFKNSDRYTLGGEALEFLEDRTSTATFEEIFTSELSAEFQPCRQAIPNFGITDSVFWFRFSLEPGQASTADRVLVLANPLLKEVTLYAPRSDGSFALEHVGIDTRLTDATPFRRNPVLSIPKEALPGTFYLRVPAPGRGVFPMAIMTHTAALQAEREESMLMVGYAGVMLTLFVLCTLLFVVVRERQYLAFAVLILFLGLFNLAIKGDLLPLLPNIAVRNYQAVVAWLGCGMTLSSIMFGRWFLHGAQYAHRIDRLLLGCSLIIPAVAVLVPLFPPSLSLMIMSNLSSIAMVLLIWTAVIASRKGFSPAIYYLIPFGLIGLSSIWIKLVSLEVLPYNSLAAHVQSLNSAAVVLCLGLALGVNFRSIIRRNQALIADLQIEVGQRTATNKALKAEMAARQQLERAIVRISDAERQRMSHELHDGLCQQLTGARLRFSALEDAMADSGLDAETRQLGQLLDDTVVQAYRLSRGLWTTETQGSGVLLDLAELAHQMATYSDIRIDVGQELHCPSCSSDNLPQVQLIAREALWNAVKHSGASRIQVSLACDPHGDIRLEVRDNGRGIADRCTRQGGMGMKIMRHRAEMIGGTLAIDAKDGGGVRICCTAPCRGLDNGGAT